MPIGVVLLNVMLLVRGAAVTFCSVLIILLVVMATVGLMFACLHWLTLVDVICSFGVITTTCLALDVVVVMAI